VLWDFNMHLSANLRRNPLVKKIEIG